MIHYCLNWFYIFSAVVRYDIKLLPFESSDYFLSLCKPRLLPIIRHYSSRAGAPEIPSLLVHRFNSYIEIVMYRRYIYKMFNLCYARTRQNKALKSLKNQPNVGFKPQTKNQRKELIIWYSFWMHNLVQQMHTGNMFASCYTYQIHSEIRTAFTKALI